MCKVFYVTEFELEVAMNPLSKYFQNKKTYCPS